MNINFVKKDVNMYRVYFIIITLSVFLFVSCSGYNSKKWKEGIVDENYVCSSPVTPENSEPSIISTGERIIVVWSGGTDKMYPDASIWLSKLEEGVWSSPVKIAGGAVDDSLKFPCSHPVLYKISGHSIGLFYKVMKNESQWEVYFKLSNDDGDTWSESVCLPEGVDINPAIGMPLKSFSGIKYFTNKSVVLKYKNSYMRLLSAKGAEKIRYCISDGGTKTWTCDDTTNLPCGNTPISAISLEDGRQLLVYNHVLAGDGKGHGCFSPLNISLSVDGRKWFASLVLEDNISGKYYMPSAIQTSDGFVHIVYSWHDEKIKYVKIDPSRLKMVEMKDGLWPGKKSNIGVADSGWKYKIAVCDWMIHKRNDAGSLVRSRNLGCNGVEVDMGGLSDLKTFSNNFNTPEKIENLKKESCMTGAEICSIAMSGFYVQSFARRKFYFQPLKDCISLAKALDVKICFLPLVNDTKKEVYPGIRNVLVKRLKKVAEIAEDSGVVIGIETCLSASDEKKLLADVGSPAVKIYFNFEQSIIYGRNVIDELVYLGTDNICQIHCTNEDKYLLKDDPKINMNIIKKVLDKINYHGWLVMQRSRDLNKIHDYKWNYSQNALYLKSVFQPE